MRHSPDVTRGNSRAQPFNKSLGKTKGMHKQRQRELSREMRSDSVEDVPSHQYTAAPIALKYIILGPCQNADPECCICCFPHIGTDIDPYAMLGCGHVFGKTCLDKSLQLSSICPLCRHPVE